MKRILGLIIPIIYSASCFAQSPLAIPPLLTGTTIILNVQSGNQTFYPPDVTPTYGVNGTWMGPTISVNKDDSITINVTNGLSVKTTMHWHGLHVAAHNDGGPHQSINPGATWNPTFKIRNNASTYWYHPHGEGQTDPQVSKGIAGFFLVHDAVELALPIPHTYGIDDLPIVVQSKAFDVLHQIAIATNMDTALFVNGTLKPYLNAPAQVLRLRLLNGSSLRSYNFGFSNGQTMYQIGTDGGLIDTPVALTRLILSPGERTEILVNFTGMIGDTIYLKSYASGLPNGVFGADTVGGGLDTIPDYQNNFLNGADFDVLKINIVAATGSPVTTIPASLVPLTPYDLATVTNYRTLVLDTIRLLPMDVPNRAEGPFAINGKSFSMDSVNEKVYLNTTEVWTIKNNSVVAHPFHIHDVQFNVIEEHGIAVPINKRHWKDVILVMPLDSVKFITKFDDFADPMVPYMYHCHILHHEDDGMMGSFIVVDSSSLSTTSNIVEAKDVIVAPNPAQRSISVSVTGVNSTNEQVDLVVYDLLGNKVFGSSFIRQTKVDITQWARGIYVLSIASKTNSVRKTLVLQ